MKVRSLAHRSRHIWSRLSGREVLLHMGQDVLYIVCVAACVRGEKLLANVTGLSILRGEAGAWPQRPVLQHPAWRPAGLRGAKGKAQWHRQRQILLHPQLRPGSIPGSSKAFPCPQKGWAVGGSPRAGAWGTLSPCSHHPPQNPPEDPVSLQPPSPTAQPAAAPVTNRPEPVKSPLVRSELEPVCSTLSVPLSLGAAGECWGQPPLPLLSSPPSQKEMSFSIQPGLRINNFPQECVAMAVTE